MARKQLAFAAAVRMALFLAACLASSGAGATIIRYQLIPLGGSDYQYVYALENDGTLGGGVPVALFDVLFDPTLYAEASLMVATAAPLANEWDELFLASAPGVPAAYDALALAGGVADGSTMTGFAVTFTWLGAGTPASQPFEIYDPLTFALLEQGSTLNAAPLPPTAWLLGSGGALLFALRARRSRSAARTRRCAGVVVAAALVGLCLAPSEVSAGVTGPPGITIHGYELVSSVRRSRTEFEYTYRADVTNWFQDAAISAALTGGGAGVIEIEGDLTFGDVADGGTSQSIDTFTIRVDRSLTFDESQLEWVVATAPLPPTTFQLIDGALATNQIDSETSLLYKTYAVYGDTRLPAAYVGREGGFREDPITAVVEAQFSTLSASTQALLAPFLKHALEPGSWQELQFAAPLQQLQTPASPKVRKARRSKSRRALLHAAAPVAQAPQAVDTANGRVRIWWYPQRPQDQARAVAFANEIDTYLWRKLTTAFQAPLDDLIGLTPTARVYHAGDPRLDIVLTTRAMGRVKAATDTSLHFCDGTPSGAIIELTPLDGNEVLAHELMHAIQFSYRTLTCQTPPSETAWLGEASATWVEHFAYPTSNSEHGFIRGGRYFAGALDFLKDPQLELNFTNQQREYGAYLWFLHLAGQGNNAGPVRAVWQGLSSQKSREAIEAVLQSSSLGGFARQWPAFALRNWNQLDRIDKPYREYFQWDQLRHHAKEAYGGPQKLVPPNNGVTIVPLDHSLPPLSARYHHFDLKADRKTHTLLFENQYAQSDPRAGVWAVVKTRSGDWVVAEDWTDRKNVAFCRDKPLEDVEELVVVITNRDFVGGPTAILGGPQTFSASPLTLKLSPLPCKDWVGGADFAMSDIYPGGSTSTIVTTTNVRFTLDASQSNDFQNVFTAVGARTDWSITVTQSGCSAYTASDSFTPAADLIVTLGPGTLYYTMRSHGPGSSNTVTVGCTGGPRDITESITDGVPSIGLLPLPNGATTIADAPGDGWSWSFTQTP